jgi:hypothetical protein
MGVRESFLIFGIEDALKWKIKLRKMQERVVFMIM